MSSLQQVNPNAQSMRKRDALMVNVTAGRGLQDVLRTNLGPRGTLKMLVGGAGQVKITKDGRVLLHEMQIQHPTACMIARTATAQDDSTGDGTTSCVLLIGELMQRAERFISEGVHPRIISDGFELAKEATCEFLEKFKVKEQDILKNREMLVNVAGTSLKTKLTPALAEHVTEICTDAVLCITKPGEPIDLHMIERMHMVHKKALDTRLVQGLVMDHGARHPDMPRDLKNCFILTTNISMEYEKTDVDSTFMFKNAEERAKCVAAERTYTDEKVEAVLELKRKVCPPGSGKTFVVVNQKGIDPMSLDMLCKEGIYALRRAKRRNMERLMLACGGWQVNSIEDLKPECLGHADHVYEETLGENKYCFVEGVTNNTSCTILLQGPNPHTIAQLKDAIRDGTRAVKNAIDDLAVVPGAGAFEIAAHSYLVNTFKKGVSGKAKLGVQAFADALLVIPKVLAENSGFDVMDSILELTEEHEKTGEAVGLDVYGGGAMLPADQGIWDNFTVKKHFIMLSTVIASQLLLVDEVMRAGRNMKRSGPSGR